MSADKGSIEALKRLRTERRQSVAQATAQMKSQRQALKAIRGVLAGEPATVPRIAEETGMPSDRVLWFVAAMKKYGEIVEDGQDGGYYRYTLVAGADASEADPPLEKQGLT